MFDRMSDFISTMFQSMDESGDDDGVDNVILVTHGLLMRIFCMCYLRWTVTEFEQVWNPGNGEIWVLQKVPGKGTYELAGRWKASRNQPAGRFVDVKFGANQNEPMPAHMKRPLLSRLIPPGGSLEGDELGHLRDLPGPRRWARGSWSEWSPELW